MDRRILILYASETGSAQDIAESIGRDCYKLYLNYEIFDMDSYNITKLPLEKLVIFVIATTGQGEFPSNSLHSWKFLLRKNLPKNSLSNTKVALCGLGDSGYKEFNFAAKKLYRRLLQLSAKFIIDPAYGDDQSPKGLYDIIDPFKEKLNIILERLYPLPIGYKKRENEFPLPKYSILFDNNNEKIISNDLLNQKPPYNNKNPYYGLLKIKKRMTELSWQQDVNHYTIEICESMKFIPGDSLAILPYNPKEEVLKFLKRTNLNPNLIIKSLSLSNIHSNDSGPKSLQHLQFPISIFELFEQYIDIMGTPRRYFFEYLSYFTSLDHEKERLLYFGSTEGQEELRLYNDKEKRTVLEILDDFPGVSIPLEHLVTIIPPIQPRLFSIASSYNLYPKQCDILVATLKFTTLLKRKRVGLCTNWLSTLNINDKIRVWIKPSSPNFHLPKDNLLPIIMVGPGTGLAPFRAFVQERVYLQKNQINTGDTILYSGCRHKDKDWYYGDEFENYKKNNLLTDYYMAFSRDNIHINNRKTYVQHLLKENKKQVWNMLNSGGYFYLSGSAVVMPQNIKDTLIEIIQEEGKKTENEAKKYLLTMETKGRYASETWQ